MATLFVSEYSSLGWVESYGTQLMHAPAAGSLVAEQALAVSGSSQASAAFNAATKLIEIVADVDCSIAFGATAPTANASYHYIPSKSTRFYAVNPGTFISCISSS